PAGAEEPPPPLEGAVIARAGPPARTERGGTNPPSGSSHPPHLSDPPHPDPAASRTGVSPPATSPPRESGLVMRSFRQKELPLRVETVASDRATIRIAGSSSREVAVGQSIPGTTLQVVQVDRRLRETKENEGRPVEVSILEVED